MFLSRDLVDLMLDDVSSLDFNMPDDVAINTWVHAKVPTMEFHYIESVRPTTQEELDAAMGRGVIHFRFHRGFGLSSDRAGDHNDMNNVVAWLKGKVREHFVTSSASRLHSLIFGSALIFVAVMLLLFARSRWT